MCSSRTDTILTYILQQITFCFSSKVIQVIEINPVSRSLAAFLNSARGGTVYLGIIDEGVVKGLYLTEYQVNHVTSRHAFCESIFYLNIEAMLILRNEDAKITSRYCLNFIINGTRFVSYDAVHFT